MAEKVQILTLLMLLILPWAVILPWWLKRFNLVSVFIGAASGLSVNITIAYCLTQWHCAEWLAVVSIVPAVAAGAILGANRRKISLYCRYLSLHETILRHGGIIALTLIAGVIYSIPVFCSEFPPGWDSTFHCLLAKKIFLTGQLALNWQPFESIPVNYTQGLHVLISGIALQSGTAVHVVFQTLHLPIMLLNTVAIYLISRQIFAAPRPAFLSGMSYCCLCGWGGFFSYYSWGGLPTELALIFGLSIILQSFNKYSLRLVLSMAVCAGGILLVHHLTAVIFAFALGFYLIADLIWQRKFNNIHRLLIYSAAAALLIFSWFIIPYSLKSHSLGGTSVLKFYEEVMIPPWQAVIYLGITLCSCAVVGIISTAANAKISSGYRLLLLWCIGLLISFAGLDYLYRGAAVWFYQENFTAFTPSRFLTLMSCPLAIFAGAGVNRLLEKTGKLTRRGEIYLFAAVVLIMPVFVLPELKQSLTREVIKPQTIAAADLISRGTPPNALVLLGMPQLDTNNLCWIPYLAWRQTLMTPIPASENRQTVFEHKIRFFQENGKDPKLVKQWLEQNRLDGYVLFADKSGKLHLRQLFNSTRQE